MSANESAAGNWRGKSVLVVDDYAAIRKMMREVFVGLGLEVEEAANGLAALEVLKRRQFDLVVTDLVMPDMDGFELTEAIKGSPELRGIPVVIISTHDDAKYIFRALHLGADDYLVKPPAADMVRTVLARMFDYEW